MALELLSGKTGRVVSGLPCIYHLPGGLLFFTEAVREDADCYIFDPAKTLQLVLAPGNHPGQLQVQSSLRVGRAACMVTDCTDPAIMKVWRSALSGIVLATDMPPGERVH
jgi:predicted sulfurtransferase